MITRIAMNMALEDYTAALENINQAARLLENSHFSVGSVDEFFQRRSAHSINQLNTLYREVLRIRADLERVRTHG
ncbi:hypothetical protein L3Q67_15725 [Saccharothrix sp. AJ9571]|nr:hypothetical protein L3Q67_15725 [Saccharothrix sp. AJ9571]